MDRIAQNQFDPQNTTCFDQGEINLRLARLESLCLRWKRAWIATVVSVLLVTIFTAAYRDNAPKIVQAEGFIVVDEHGRSRIRLGPVSDGKDCIIEFLDIDGGQRLIVGTNKEHTPFVMLTNPNSPSQLSLDVQSEFGSAIMFRNRANKSGLLLGASDQGVTGVGFFDKNGKQLLEIGLTADSKPRFTLKDIDDHVLFQAPISK